MKKISCVSFFVLMLMVCSALVSCSKDDTGETEDESSIASLDALDYTTDGYFDGVLYYQITSNSGNTATITKCTPDASSVMQIPSYVKINGKKYSITSVSAGAFDECGNISSLVIPNTVVSIGARAFGGCRKLASVVFGKNVKYVGENAFYGNFPERYRDDESQNGSINRLEFADMESLCRIMCANYINRGSNTQLYVQGEEVHDIIIPNSVTSICTGAFYGCSGLTSVVIGKGVVSIGGLAFFCCRNLTSVVFGKNVKDVGEDAFSGASPGSDGGQKGSIGRLEFADVESLCRIMCANYINRDSDAKLYVQGEEVHDIVIPNSITSIRTYAFYSCRSLTSVTIPNSVTTIENYAFSYCSGLTSVTIPNSVTSIGPAFWGCSGLTSVTIPNSVTTIKKYAFWECSGLTSVTIPNSVTTIEEGAFSYCSGLTSVIIPNSVTSIGAWAFMGCEKLTSVTIPYNVTSIGYEAFNGCIGLEWIKVEAVTPPEMRVLGYNMQCPIYVPQNSVEVYKTTKSSNVYSSREGWIQYADRIQGF